MDLIIVIQTSRCNKPRTSHSLHLFNVICTYTQMAMVHGHLCHCLTSGVIGILARVSYHRKPMYRFIPPSPHCWCLQGLGELVDFTSSSIWRPHQNKPLLPRNGLPSASRLTRKTFFSFVEKMYTYHPARAHVI